VRDAPIIRGEWEWVRDVVEIAVKDRLEGNNDLEAFMLDNRRTPGYIVNYGWANGRR